MTPVTQSATLDGIKGDGSHPLEQTVKGILCSGICGISPVICITSRLGDCRIPRAGANNVSIRSCHLLGSLARRTKRAEIFPLIRDEVRAYVGEALAIFCIPRNPVGNGSRPASIRKFQKFRRTLQLLTTRLTASLIFALRRRLELRRSCLICISRVTQSIVFSVLCVQRLPRVHPGFMFPSSQISKAY